MTLFDAALAARRAADTHYRLAGVFLAVAERPDRANDTTALRMARDEARVARAYGYEFTALVREDLAAS